MTIVFLDIETLPCTDPQIIAEIHASVHHPKTLKKAESIAQWWKDEGEQAKADAVAKTSFDGAYGRIACICAAADDSGPVEFADDDEAAMLISFNAWLYDVAATRIHDGAVSTALQFCGHNIAGFDIPFLKHRSMVNSVKPHPQLLKAMSAKPWDVSILDTMLMWSPDSQKRASMDKLCRIFGIPGKGCFDGSMVAETWPVDPVKVIDYCLADVIRTRQIYNHLTFKGA